MTTLIVCAVQAWLFFIWGKTNGGSVSLQKAVLRVVVPSLIFAWIAWIGTDGTRMFADDDDDTYSYQTEADDTRLHQFRAMPKQMQDNARFLNAARVAICGIVPGCVGIFMSVAPQEKTEG